MHKLIIAIEPPFDEVLFDTTWPILLNRIEKMPGLQRESISRVYKTVYGNYAYSLVHELYFESMEAIQAAMASEEGREAGRLLQSLTNGRVALVFADHKEDDLANIRRHREPDKDA